jgi:hypothetical protein
MLSDNSALKHNSVSGSNLVQRASSFDKAGAEDHEHDESSGGSMACAHNYHTLLLHIGAQFDEVGTDVRANSAASGLQFFDANTPASNASHIFNKNLAMLGKDEPWTHLKVESWKYHGDASMLEDNKRTFELQKNGAKL